MAKIIWTKRALDDIDEIAGFIALSNHQAAIKLIDKLFQIVTRLELFPESGRVPPELAGSHYREIIVNPCRVFYKLKGGNVHILQVIRQERDLRNYMIQESESSYEVRS